MSRPEVFGLSVDGAHAEIDRMLKVVREVFKENGVCGKDIEAISPAILPESFERIEPPDPV
jgi:hypothetical protein